MRRSSLLLVVVMITSLTSPTSASQDPEVQESETFPGFRTTELPFQRFGALAVGNGGRTFVSAGPDGRRVVSVRAGGEIHRIRGRFDGPTGLAIHEGSLYVAEHGGGVIRRLGIPGLRRFQRFVLPPPGRPGELASAGGKLWTTLGSCGTSDHHMVALDPETSDVSGYPSSPGLYPDHCIGFTTAPELPDILAAWEREEIDPQIFVFDVQDDQPDLLWSDSIGTRIRDLAIDSNAHELLVAHGSTIERRDLSSGAEMGWEDARVTALQSSAARRTIAFGMDEHQPRVVLRREEDPVSHVYFPSLGRGRLIASGGLRWRGERDLVHAVSLQPDGDARLHIFNPEYRQGTLRLRVSKKTMRAGKRVRVIARLLEPGAGSPTRKIAIYRTPRGTSQRRFVKEAPMDERGRVRVWLRPFRNTDYDAVWEGDQRFAEDAGRARLRVRLAMRRKLRGEHHRRGRVRYYGLGDRITFRVRTKPRRSDIRLLFEIQARHRNGWRAPYTDDGGERYVKLRRGVAVRHYWPRRDLYLGRFRIRAIHVGDVKQVRTATRWIRFQIDPGYPPF